MKKYSIHFSERFYVFLTETPCFLCITFFLGCHNVCRTWVSYSSKLSAMKHFANFIIKLILIIFFLQNFECLKLNRNKRHISSREIEKTLKIYTKLTTNRMAESVTTEKFGSRIKRQISEAFVTDFTISTAFDEDSGIVENSSSMTLQPRRMVQVNYCCYPHSIVIHKLYH